MIDSYILQAFDACKTGNKKTLQSLIQSNRVSIDATLPFTNIFDVNFINASMLQVACAYGRLNTVDYLLSRGADINYREGNGHYALHFAALGRHSQIVRKLLSKGSDAKCRNFQGFTPLHFGCKLGGTDSIRELITGVEKKTETMQKSISEEKMTTHFSTMDLTTEKADNKADVDARSYSEEKTPLHVACENSRLTSAQVLVEFKADVNAVTTDNWAPIHYACNVKNTQLVNFLIDSGADVNAKTKEGDTPLHFAAKNKSKQIMERLIAENADISAHNKGGETPIILAAAAGDVECFMLILRSGAKISETNNRKQTALHQAVQHRNIEIVKILMQKGADPDAYDIYNNSPLTKARIKEYDEMIPILMAKTTGNIRETVRRKTQEIIRRSQLNLLQPELSAESFDTNKKSMDFFPL